MSSPGRLHVVLYHPEIPHNTGAVGRLCLATQASLHLIKPLGFSLEDRYLRRAGLDYWQDVDVQVWDDYETLVAAAAPEAKFLYLTTKATQTYWDHDFTGECYLVLGPESRGLPESLLHQHPADCWRIPMTGTRSLNLSTAAGIVLYEAMRQRALPSGV
jgi:tRNA (cytidine/uridine-2'-O-)-methyltransferase